MRKKIFSPFYISLSLLLAASAGCSKGSLEINSTNPNLPSSVSPQYVLSATLTGSAYNHYAYGYGLEPFQFYMGYWAYSGDYGVSSADLTYANSTGDFNNNWNPQYTNMVNYKLIETESASDSLNNYYEAISKIMLAYHFGILVDLYNDVPYLDALQGGTINYPDYTPAATVYTSCIHQLDSAVALINSAPGTAANPQKYDVMFGGNMSEWIQFANTVKLKMLLHLTAYSAGASLITSELNGLTPASFLGVGQDAAVNPGYSNSEGSQQSPIWQNVGFNTAGSPNEGNELDRACTFAVTFYQGTNDPRDSLFYLPNQVAGVVKGRAFGSTNSGVEHNNTISAVGDGILKSPSEPAYLIPASESLFLQAEAAELGYISGDPATLFNEGVSESFRILGVPSYATAATTYTSQNDARVNYSVSTDKMTTIITQKWAAMNMFDPIEAWDDWRKLGIPAGLPVSIYPGTIAPHVPYRILYPVSEYNYNSENVAKEGTISNITSKIFWMP